MCIEKNILIKKTYTIGLNMGFPLRAWVEKKVYGVETHWFSGKEKILGIAVRKEGHADSPLGDERTQDLISLKKVQL